MPTAVNMSSKPAAAPERSLNQRMDALTKANEIRTARAQLKRDLVRYFGVPGYNLDTVGYGEDFLLVPTQNENWRNRRVTIRRVTDVVSPY